MRGLLRRKKTAQYPIGTCTRWVYDTVPWVPLGWGHAARWGSSAARAGLRVETVPGPGCIAVWHPGERYGAYGHVALVTDHVSQWQITVLDAAGAHTMYIDHRRDLNEMPSYYIYPPVDTDRRLPDGPFESGRGAAPDAINDVLRAWDGVSYYWNTTAPLQAIRGGVITGMLAGLF